MSYYKSSIEDFNNEFYKVFYEYIPFFQTNSSRTYNRNFIFTPGIKQTNPLKFKK